MKHFKYFISERLVFAVLFIGFWVPGKSLFAQYDSIPARNNVIKTNPYGYLIDAYTFGYERMVAPSLSLQLIYARQEYTMDELRVAPDKSHEYDYHLEYGSNVVIMAMRHYMFNSAYQPHGLFIGVNFLYEADKEYATFLNNDPNGIGYYFTQRTISRKFGPGISLGYQLLLFNRVTVELNSYLVYAFSVIESDRKVIENDDYDLPGITNSKPALPAVGIHIGYAFF